VLSTRSPVDHEHHRASCDTWLVVSGGVDWGRRRRNVYDKKPQRYAKDNRTAHLIARSDKSVAYVTNNKLKLYSTFCTVEANYWQTRSIALPLCDSRATCLMNQLVKEFENRSAFAEKMVSKNVRFLLGHPVYSAWNFLDDSCNRFLVTNITKT